MKEKEFARLVREHKATIYTVCYMFSDDADEVANLFQEVLIRLWKGLGDFRGDSSPKTWIYRISLNTCISETRRTRRHEHVSLDMTANLFEDNDAETRRIVFWLILSALLILPPMRKRRRRYQDILSHLEELRRTLRIERSEPRD